MGSNQSHVIDVVEIGASGARKVATLDGGFVASAQLDPRGEALYLTRSERGIHNICICRLQLAGGSVQNVTDNEPWRCSRRPSCRRSP